MNDRGLRAAVQFIRQIADLDRAAELADADLLRRFVERRDEAAFAALVGRHGPLVLGVCRRVLANRADVEDAFQATFLVLVRKARSIVKQRSVGSWLYGVAYRVAARARGEQVRRRRCEAQTGRAPAADALHELAWRDVRAVLDEEVLRLPARCRLPFVLCYLEGRTTEEAAGLLGCPRGTVLSRLARARELLRARLVRRGVGVAGGVLAALLPRAAAEAALPAELADAALRAAAGAPVTAGALCLAEGVLRAMLLTRVRTALILLLAVCLLAGGGAMLAQPGDAEKGAPAQPVPRGAAATPAGAAPAWGKATGGLRLGILAGGPGDKGTGQVFAVLENVGKDGLVLNLGTMLAGGKKHLPTAVRLTLTDAANKPRTLHFYGHIPGVAGRVDPIVVPLPAGCRYTLRCVLDDYTDDDLTRRGVSLPAGRYRVAAEFRGQRVEHTNADMPGLALMPYWTGTVTSGEVAVTVPAPH
jgi:RNA polymerase sigma factor (sigma-70 family)